MNRADPLGQQRGDGRLARAGEPTQGNQHEDSSLAAIRGSPIISIREVKHARNTNRARTDWIQTVHRPGLQRAIGLTLYVGVYTSDAASHVADIGDRYQLDTVAVRYDLKTLSGHEAQRLTDGFGNDYLKLGGDFDLIHADSTRSSIRKS